METKWRFGATVVVWAFATLMAIIALGNAGLGWIEDWVIVVPLGVALIATIAIWESGKPDSSKSSNESSSGKKSDNTAYNMALLMEMMDEDEREEFKYRLKERILSNETITDDSLIRDIEKRKRG